MTYDIRHNRLRAARMKFGCEGRVHAYREKAWSVALEEARKRTALQTFLAVIVAWMHVDDRSV
jgi:hypothetical protein